jgi:hypothetical protein
MHNKKVLIDALKKLGSAKAPSKPKDIITDPMGQWKFPGQNTRIPSNDITMEGVPYPVFAQPNVGPGVMMYPGQDYYFPDADYVDETPHMQDGGVNPLEGDLISKVIMNRNKDKDFVQRAYALGDNPGTPMFNVPDNEQFGQNMSHKMAWGEDDNGQSWMFPTILNPNDEAIQVPNQYADYISSKGYKNATGMNQYEDGGIYINAELTPKEIEEYAKGGFIIEDISIPELTKAQTGKEIIKLGKKVLKPVNETLKKKFPNTTAFNQELIGNFTNRNRLQTLREAENWMGAWAQHPVTQQKILDSYKLGLKQPKKGVIFHVPNLPEHHTIASSPIEAHNLAEGIKFSGGYNPTGRLSEYPLSKQLLELPKIGVDGMHANDILGRSFTHKNKPGDWLEEENIFIPKEFSTKVKKTKEPFSYGNYISRKLTPEDRLSTGIHELTHDWVKAPTLVTTQQNKVLLNGLDHDLINEIKQKNKDDNDVINRMNYLSEPTEVHARLMEARHYFNLTPDDVVTPDLAKKIKRLITKGDTPIDQSFGLILGSDKKVAEMFNKAWLLPAAVGVGALQQEKDGGSVDYELGDEIDEATMKKLEQLGYTFEKI